jgi:carotenoid cleavage dioxygenase-like enzyme
MIHGVWLEGGQARYANRWIRTNGLKAEERAGRALYGGIMTPAFVDMSLLGDDPDPGWPFKVDAFVNVIEHAGRYLALEEGTPPYEITAALETVGRCGPRRRPAGRPDRPPQDRSRDGRDGAVPLRRGEAVPHVGDHRPRRRSNQTGDRDRGHRPGLHDPRLRHHPELRGDLGGAAGIRHRRNDDGRERTGLEARAGHPGGARPPRWGEVRWVETEPFWAWHHANAYEDGDQIVLDNPGSSAPVILLPPEERKHITSGFSRATINLARATMSVERIDDVSSELPRIDDRLSGLPHRYVTVASQSGRTALQPAEHDRLRLYDMQAGTSTYADTNAAA